MDYFLQLKKAKKNQSTGINVLKDIYKLSKENIWLEFINVTIIGLEERYLKHTFQNLNQH